MASTACMSKLQLQTRFGDKPCEYCMEVLTLTPSLYCGRAQVLRHGGATQHWLIFKHLEPCQHEDVYLLMFPLAHGWQQCGMGGWGEHPQLSLGPFALQLAFPLQCVPRAPHHTAATTPCYEMAQQHTGVPETHC